MTPCNPAPNPQGHEIAVPERSPDGCDWRVQHPVFSYNHSLTVCCSSIRVESSRRYKVSPAQDNSTILIRMFALKIGVLGMMISYHRRLELLLQLIML